MEKYILNKQTKGKKYEYTVTDENGKVISTRMSARDYVVCTENGEFYFGRLDLIGKRDHGKYLRWVNEILANPDLEYKKQTQYYTPEDSKIWITKNPIYEWINQNIDYATRRKQDLTAIAYFQQ